MADTNATAAAAAISRLRHKCSLFLVCFDRVDQDGDDTENFDLFVMAEDGKQAVELWRSHYRMTPQELVDNSRVWLEEGQSLSDITPEELEAAQLFPADQDPNSVFIVPVQELLIQNPRPIAWAHVERFN